MRKLKHVLLILLVLGVCAAAAAGGGWLSYDLGRDSVDCSQATAQVVDRFEAGKATLCDLDENGRLFVCPAMRRAIPMAGGAALAYICDAEGKTGYISFLNVAKEAKAQAILQMVGSGLKVKPHCSKGGEEVVAVGAGEGARTWKTATR